MHDMRSMFPSYEARGLGHASNGCVVASVVDQEFAVARMDGRQYFCKEHAVGAYFVDIRLAAVQGYRDALQYGAPVVSTPKSELATRSCTPYPRNSSVRPLAFPHGMLEPIALKSNHTWR
jgi:hypothetical protein